MYFFSMICSIASRGNVAVATRLSFNLFVEIINSLINKNLATYAAVLPITNQRLPIADH
jgi:hypothetical protein